MLKPSDSHVRVDLPPPGGVLSRRWSTLFLLLALILSGLGLVSAGAPAHATTLADARCGGRDLGSGICVGDSHGETYWLGTRLGYDGVELYCIDYQYATRWGVEHRTTLVSGSLMSSLGAKVAPATVAALSYLVTRHPADRTDDTNAAAISLVIREVMGDVRRGAVQVIPGGLTVGGLVRDVPFVPESVILRAQDLWDEARDHRGPWDLSVTLKRGADHQVTLGERVTAVVRARSAAGLPQDATVRFGYRSFTGPAAVRLGADGVARVVLTAPGRPSTGSVTARIDAAPNAHPFVIVPMNWSVNRRPGQASSMTQRGLIVRQGPVVARATATTTIVKVTPVVTTVASSERVEPGSKIHDTVVLSGTRGVSTSFRWSLLGPVGAHADGSCPGVGAAAWREAQVIVSGSVTAPGDGVYKTPGYAVRRADIGCLTYVEQLEGTTTTHPVTTPPGLVKETVLVVRPKSNPCVRTVASRQNGLIGTELYDRVSVGCISGPDRVVVQWTAHGPIAPLTVGPEGCDQIPVATWRAAPVAAQGSFVATKAGTASTRAFTVTRPGCYTFSEKVAATATTVATSNPPGIAVETALFTRPPVTQVPVVPSGYRLAAAPLRTETYAGRVWLGDLGISAPVTKVGASGGAMAIPRDPSLLGWLRQTATAEDVVGSSVVAGHITSTSGRPGALTELAHARPGMTATWTDARGSVHRFVVGAVRKYSRAEALPAAIFRTDGPHVLRLITCTDRVRLADGTFHYANNLVVTAKALS